MNNYIYFPQSELGNIPFPECICIYKYTDNKYMMVEVNTGHSKGSIKPITCSYSNINNLLSGKKHNSVLPLLKKYIIYNDHVITKL